jgi:hypothetical protein
MCTRAGTCVVAWAGTLTDTVGVRQRVGLRVGWYVGAGLDRRRKQKRRAHCAAFWSLMHTA